jgi:hypothetical protein
MMSVVSHTRFCRTVAIAVALLVATPDAAVAASGTAASKSMDRMSPQELDLFVQQLNETANWRKYRRPSDPPDFVPGKPVKVMHGAGSSFGRSGGGGSGGFRKSGLANRRGARAGRGKNRDDAMAQGRGSSRSGRSSLGSGSGSRSSSSSGSSSRSRSNTGFGSSSRNSGSSFGNSNGGGGLDQ